MLQGSYSRGGNPAISTASSTVSEPDHTTHGHRRAAVNIETTPRTPVTVLAGRASVLSTRQYSGT